MMQPTNTARIYPNINPAAMSVSSGRYSPTAGYRARLPTSGIFSPFDDPFLQARAAQAALAEMDVKNVNVNVSAHAANMLRTSEMFS
ncbi:hypothetical protein Ddc_13173 [Ditylenchus destructor]|nr:hypothetical protein Ddc_13173 [Ditylenchus destructor]